MVNRENLIKQWLTTFLKLIVATLLIFWLVQSGRFDLKALAKISSPITWIFGLVTFPILLCLNTKRWQLLLNLEQVSIPFWKAFQLSLIGIFFNFFMPGGVGGDVVKAGYLMADFKQKKWFIGWSILVDRALGLLALLLYSGVTGLLFYQKLPEPFQLSFYSLSLLIVCGFFGLVLTLVLSPKSWLDRLICSHPLLEKTIRPLFFFFRKPKKIFIPFFMSFISQGLVISMGVFLIYKLNVELPIWMVLLVFPFGFLATILPISPAGIGVGQAAFFFLFDKVAGQGELGVLTITYYQAIQFIIGLIGGLLFISYKKKPSTVPSTLGSEVES